MSKVITKKEFNKILENCFKNVEIRNDSVKNISNLKFKTMKEYQNSFDKIIKFSKLHDKLKKDIDVIIYNESNSDGMFSALVAYMFLYKDNKKTINIIPAKPSHGQANKRLKQYYNEIEKKTVLIVDLSQSKDNLEILSSYAKQIIVLDDHPKSVKFDLPKNVIEFISDEHAACAIVWKFFYPDKDVPLPIIYIDDSDRKLMLPFVYYSYLFAEYIGYKFSHNVLISKTKKRQLEGGLMSELYKILTDKSTEVILVIGNYYSEVTNMIKYQIVNNMVVKKFQGYKVGTLNFNAPRLSKMVAREMFNVARARNVHIDFAVLWGYEFTSNAWKILLREDHTGKAPKYNLGDMAHKLGKIGGHPKGGHGAKYDGNFYWSKDIFLLFDKKFI